VRDRVQWVAAMTRHSRPRARAWMLMAGVITLIAGHGIILYYFSSHIALSAAVVSGVIILFVIKHLGLLGPVYTLFRRRARRKPPL
jgi:hypothetical protein